jgi:rod shape-determining protein MreC
MPKERSTLQRILIAVVFILLEVAALLMLSHNSQIQRLWIARISHGVMARTWGASQNISNYFSLKKQNDELVLENDRLGKIVRSYELAAKAASPDSKPVMMDNGFEYIPATIIKASTKTQHNYLIIDKGSEDGVRRNSGVITSKGVIGIVDAVSRHYSYAISFLNTELFISARLGESGAVGPLAWDGTSSDKAILKEIPLQFKFEPGDTVFTSGYSSIFPPDIPIGIAGDSKIINGATNEIKVSLFQNHKALKYVTIVQNTRIEEIEAIENQEDHPKK